MIPRTAHRHARATLLIAALALVGAACTDDSAWTPPVAADSAESGVNAAPVEQSFDELDRIVESAMEETGIPGVAVAVVHADEVAYTQGYGVRSIAGGQPVSPDTVFQIASMSKPLSSTIMSGLVGDGVIGWDEPLAESGWTDSLNDPWVSENVTYADLFSHRSGLPGGTAGNDLEAIGYDRTTILERLPQVPLDPFRERKSYSNWGMTLGGEAAAAAADTSWEQLGDDVLFEPAGMADTSMRHEDFLAAENRAELHVRTDEGWDAVIERQPDQQAPAGGVSSTVVDLAQWVQLHLSGGVLDGEQLIDAEALGATYTPAIDGGGPPPTDERPPSSYGLGWNVGTDANGRVVRNHSGAFSAGASTAVKLVPSADVGIVVLTNGEPIGVPEAIADAYLDYLADGEVTTDWVELWAERVSGVYGEPLDTTPPADPTPARPDDAYAGTYANGYVGEAEVVAGADGLAVLLGPDRMPFPLRHLDGDTFIYLDAPELPDFPALAEFVVDESGRATSLTLSSLDGSGLGTVTRT